MVFIYCEWWEELFHWMRMGFSHLFEIGGPFLASSMRLVGEW